MLNTIELANRTFKPSRYYPTPMMGPVLIGIIATSSGNFIPISKGLKQIEKAVPWNIQCGIISAIFYHVAIFDDYVVGATVRNYIVGHQLDRLTARFLVIAFFVVMGQVHTRYGSHVNPFAPVHKVLYRVTGEVRALPRTLSARNLKSKGRELQRSASRSFSKLKRKMSGDWKEEEEAAAAGGGGGGGGGDAAGNGTPSSRAAALSVDSVGAIPVAEHSESPQKAGATAGAQKEAAGELPFESNVEVRMGLNDMSQTLPETQMSPLGSGHPSSSNLGAVAEGDEGPAGGGGGGTEAGGAAGAPPPRALFEFEQEHHQDLFHAALITLVPLLALMARAYRQHGRGGLAAGDVLGPGEHLAHCTYLSALRYCEPRVLLLEPDGALALYGVPTPRDARAKHAPPPLWTSRLEDALAGNDEAAARPGGKAKPWKEVWQRKDPGKLAPMAGGGGRAPGAAAEGGCAAYAQVDPADGALKVYYGADLVWASRGYVPPAAAAATGRRKASAAAAAPALVEPVVLWFQEGATMTLAQNATEVVASWDFQEWVG